MAVYSANYSVVRCILSFSDFQCSFSVRCSRGVSCHPWHSFLTPQISGLSMCAAKLTQGRVEATWRRRNWFRGMVCLVKKKKKIKRTHWMWELCMLQTWKKYRDCRPFHSCDVFGGQSLHYFSADAFKHGPSLVMIYQEDIIIFWTFACRFIQSERQKDPSRQSRGWIRERVTYKLLQIGTQ